MTFTNEQLIAAAMSRIEFLEMMLAGEPESLKERALAIELQLARMALAGMEAEHGHNPVMAYADSYRGMAKQGVESIPVWSVITDLERNIAPHFIAPQPLTTTERAELENYRNAQQVVPGELANKSFEYIANKFQVPISDAQWILVGWNACRAAMQGKSGQVIQDGWVACSERMPEESECVLIWDGRFRRVSFTMYGHWQYPEPETITHWQPLAAAPQQEVKP